MENYDNQEARWWLDDHKLKSLILLPSYSNSTIHGQIIWLLNDKVVYGLESYRPDHLL